MQCKEIELVLEQEGVSPLPQVARTHVADCARCRNLVADFAAILAAAESLPAEVEPPARLWVALRAQLQAEGLIRIPAAQVSRERARSWRDFGGLFLGRALATACVGVLVLGAVFFRSQPDAGAPSVTARNSSRMPFAATALALREQESDMAKLQLVSSSSVDTSLKQSLAIVDQFISDCEQRVQSEPQDDLAREYLSGAYQQKAELLAAMMERGGSAH